MHNYNRYTAKKEIDISDLKEFEDDEPAVDIPEEHSSGSSYR